MRAIYRAFVNRVGTEDALRLAHDLEHWHGPMVAHRAELAALGFATDGHPTWLDCPHADARSLWARAVTVLGGGAGALQLLQTCGAPTGPSSRSAVIAVEPLQVGGIAPPL